MRYKIINVIEQGPIDGDCFRISKINIYEMEKEQIKEKIIELNWELLNAIRFDDTERIKELRKEIDNLITLYLKK